MAGETGTREYSQVSAFNIRIIGASHDPKHAADFHAALIGGEAPGQQAQHQDQRGDKVQPGAYYDGDTTSVVDGQSIKIVSLHGTMDFKTGSIAGADKGRVYRGAQAMVLIVASQDELQRAKVQVKQQIQDSALILFVVFDDSRGQQSDPAALKSDADTYFLGNLSEAEGKMSEWRQHMAQQLYNKAQGRTPKEPQFPQHAEISSNTSEPSFISRNLGKIAGFSAGGGIVGAVIGGVIGFAAGGPVGAAIGAAIGGVSGIAIGAPVGAAISSRMEQGQEYQQLEVQPGTHTMNGVSAENPDLTTEARGCLEQTAESEAEYEAERPQGPPGSP